MNTPSITPIPFHLRRLALAASAAVLTLTTTLAPAQDNFSKVEIKVTKVAGSVYMLEGSGGNIAVSVGDDGVLMVDDEFAPLAPKIKAAIKGLSGKPIKFVLNTHFHGDHSGGNPEFGRDAVIVAHDNVHQRLKAGTDGKAPLPESLPVISFNDTATVHLNGEDIRAIHFPHGHTDGDSVIYFPKSNVVHLGDDFVTYGFPFVDTGSGGSISGMIAGLEKALAMLPPDVRVIPGHGPISTPDDVRKFIAMMKDTRTLVANALQAGQSAEDMKKANVLAKYADLGKGFIKTDAWIEQLCADVKNK